MTLSPRAFRLVFCVWFLTFSPALADDFSAGAASLDITPPTGFAMWGYSARKDAPSTGVLDPLYARAAVLAVGKKKLAIVSLDLGRAPSRQSTQAIRRTVQKEAGIDHVFLVGSHTHHGPVIELDDWPSSKNSYVRQLEQKLADVILRADKRLVPARFGIATKDVGWNRNRHSKRPDKPVDPQLIVLRLEDLSGKPIAHLVNFAAHPTMHPAKVLQFSADYPGVLAKLVEKETGAPCLFLQGAAGDLSTNAGAAPGPEKFGQALGNDVLKLAGTIRCETQQTTLQVREEDFRFASRVDLANPIVNLALSKAFFPALIRFYEREYREGVRPQLTTALLDGKIGFVSVSGEFFCAHSLRLKQRARLEHLLFLGYCNDYQQYFPTIEAVAEGGYGTEPFVSPAEIGAGERIMDRALIHLLEMGGKLKK
jgi:neutral ceramidase